MKFLGNVKLYPGKPSTPVTKIVSLGNNMFHLDLDDNESGNLSKAGEMTTTFKLRSVQADQIQLFDKVF